MIMGDQSATEIMQASIAHSMAQAVQDAVDTLKNISILETTVIGVASAKWVAQPEMVAYEIIIKNAQANIQFAVKNLTEVGQAAASVVKALQTS